MTRDPADPPSSHAVERAAIAANITIAQAGGWSFARDRRDIGLINPWIATFSMTPDTSRSLEAPTLAKVADWAADEVLR